MLLAGLSALALSLTARAGGRVGGATLAATAYTLVRLLAQLELLVLTGVRPQIPLAAAGGPGAGPGSLGTEPAHAPPPLGRRPSPAGALYALRPAPHPVALHHRGGDGDLEPRRSSWKPPSPPSRPGAAGALAGWALGALLRPLPAPATAAVPATRPPGTARPARAPARAPRRRRPAPPPSGRPRLAIALAVAVLFAFWMLPRRRRTPGPCPGCDTRAGGRQEVVGTLALDPPVPVAGQPLTVQLTITDPFLISNQTLIPFESVRAGDVQQGVLRAGTQPGLYQATFTPQEPGRRWISAYLQVEEQRTAASAAFVVYPPGEAPRGGAPRGTARSSCARSRAPIRPSPGALQPLAYLALGVLCGGAAAAVYAALTRDRTSPAPVAR